MKEVSKDEFFATVGPINCTPRPIGEYPYTSIYETPNRVEVGRVEHKLVDGKYPPQATYLLPETNRSRPTCDCGAEGEWHGPRDGRRVFACAACYEAQRK